MQFLLETKKAIRPFRVKNCQREELDILHMKSWGIFSRSSEMTLFLDVVRSA